MYRLNDHLVLRSFGSKEADIDIDFQQPVRPRLVTEILECCSESSDIEPGYFWEMTVSRRIEALLAIVTNGGTTELALQFPCSRDTCTELMETGLSMQEIIEMQPPGEYNAPFPIDVKGTDYFFRRPTGTDQLNWLKASFAHEAEALESMIRTLWVQPGEKKTVEPGWLEAVDEGMNAMDPLVHFNITICCPECNNENVCFIDLEDLLLRKLHDIQLGLLHDIHRLACRYHWSEREILALSPRRRTHYLSLIDDRDNIM